MILPVRRYLSDGRTLALALSYKWLGVDALSFSSCTFPLRPFPASLPFPNPFSFLNPLSLSSRDDPAREAVPL
jgi:hypothetical protein